MSLDRINNNVQLVLTEDELTTVMTLPEFENKLTDLLDSVKKSAKHYFFARKFPDALAICNRVLTLEPEDWESQDLKEDIEHLKNESNSNIETRDETKSMKVGRRLNVSRSFMSSNESTTTTSQNGTTSTESSVETRGSVLKKIQRFERKASKVQGGSNTSLNMLNVNIQSSSTISVSSTTSTKLNCSESPKDEKSNVKKPTSPILPKVNTQSQTQPKNMQVEPKTKVIPKISSYIPHKSIESIWNDAGLKIVSPEFRKELEKEFFSSTLLTHGVFGLLTTGEIFGMTPGCTVSLDEIKIMLSGMQKREFFTSSKIELCKNTYSCLSATGHVLRCRKNTSQHDHIDFNCTTFKKSFLISLYAYPVLPKSISKLIENIEKLISSYGY